MPKIIIRKPYQRLIFEGVQIDAIVAYGKMPNLKKSKEGVFGRKVTFTAQYRKVLQIDCWLFVVRFAWLTRITSK